MAVRQSRSSQLKRLGLLLRQFRLDAGLKQADVATRLDEPQSFVSRYERGEQRLDLAELQIVCCAIGISLVKVVKLFEEDT